MVEESATGSGSHTPEEAGTRSGSRERPRVLLVEDDENLRGAYRTLLEARGLSVLGAGSVGAALELLEEEPHLAVADLGLPDGDGTAVLDRLRRTAPELPVLVLTGTDSPDLRRDCRRLGAAGYLVKPVGGKELAARIREVLRFSP